MSGYTFPTYQADFKQALNDWSLADRILLVTPTKGWGPQSFSVEFEESRWGFNVYHFVCLGLIAIRNSNINNNSNMQ